MHLSLNLKGFRIHFQTKKVYMLIVDMIFTGIKCHTKQNFSDFAHKLSKIISMCCTIKHVVVARGESSAVVMVLA